MRFDDYLLRAIEQLSQALANILRLSRSGMVEQAEAELSDAYDALLGGDRVFLGMVDSATLSNLLGSPEKTRMLAELSRVEAQLSEQRGESARAERLRARADELFTIAQREDPQGDSELG